MKSALGDRMKDYESVFSHEIPRKTACIIRVDGRAFHTLTRGLEKPFDKSFMQAMQEVAETLLLSVQNAKLAYVQSDEVSILLDDRDKMNTDCFFGRKINKLVSITASTATRAFNKRFMKSGIFDSRAFMLPDHEVANYFIWRQRDWERNSLNMFAQSFFSQKELNKKNRADIHEMLYRIDENWSKLPYKLKNGIFIYRKERDLILTSPKMDYRKMNRLIEKSKEVSD